MPWNGTGLLWADNRNQTWRGKKVKRKDTRQEKEIVGTGPRAPNVILGRDHCTLVRLFAEMSHGRSNDVILSSAPIPHYHVFFLCSPFPELRAGASNRQEGKTDGVVEGVLWRINASTLYISTEVVRSNLQH